MTRIKNQRHLFFLYPGQCVLAALHLRSQGLCIAQTAMQTLEACRVIEEAQDTAT